MAAVHVCVCVFMCMCVCVRMRVCGYKRLDNRQRAQEEGALPGGCVCFHVVQLDMTKERKTE